MSDLVLPEGASLESPEVPDVGLELPEGAELELPEGATVEAAPSTLAPPEVQALAASPLSDVDPDFVQAFGKSKVNIPLLGETEVGATPLSAASYLVNKFKRHLINPIVEVGQKAAREFWENRAPQGLEAMKNLAPEVVTGAENVLRHAIGETPFNTRDPEKVDKRAIQGRDAMTKRVGPGVAAFVDNLTYEGAGLPFFLIDGWAAEGQAALRGLQGGFVSGLAEPGVDPVQAAVTGGTIGAGVQGAVKAVSKGVDAFKSLRRGKAAEVAREFTPVATVPAENMTQFADEAAKLPEIAIASKEMPSNTIAIIEAVEDGVPVKKAVTLLDGTPVLQRLSDKTPVIPKGSSIKEAPLTIKTSEAEAAQLYTDPVWKPGAWIQPDEIHRIDDWDARANPDVREGGVLVIEGGDGDGTARLYDVRSRNLQAEILRKRGLAELELEDGSKVLGYPIPAPGLDIKNVDVNGNSWTVSPARLNRFTLMMPDASEMLPRGAKTDIPVMNEGRLRLVEDTQELRKILDDAEFNRLQAQDEAALMQADVAATQRDIAAGGTGDGAALDALNKTQDALDNAAPTVAQDVGFTAAPSNAPTNPGRGFMNGAPPGGGGGTPPGATGGSLPPVGPQNVGPLDGLKAAWLSSVWNPAMKRFLNPTARGALDAADQAFMSHSVDTFQDLAGDTFKMFQKLTPSLQQAPLPQQRLVFNSIERFETGDLSLDQLKRMHPEISADLANKLEEARLQTAADDTKLRELGMIESEREVRKRLALDPAQQLPGYIPRLYWRQFLKPGEWKRIAEKDQRGMAALTESIRQEVYTKGEYGNMTHAEQKVLAERHLDFLLGDPEKMAQAASNPESVWTQGHGKATASTKQRQDLQWWEKAALGEIDSPFIRMAEARSRQKQLVVMGEVNRSVAGNPQMSSFADDPLTAKQLGHTVQVPAQPGRWGKLTGKFVSPETFEALEQAPLAQKNISGFLPKIMNAIKYNQTVLNHGSWFMNFMGNAQGMMLSNLVDPWASPLKVGKGMHTWAKDYAAHLEAPGIAGNVERDRFQRAMELGIVGSDYSSAEFRRSGHYWLKEFQLEEKLNKGAGVNALDTMVRVAKGSKDKLASAYGAIDTMWKYAAFTAGLEKGGVDLKTGDIVNVEKAIDFVDRRYRPGMSMKELKRQVELETTRRIHLSFPMLDRVGPAVAKAGQMGGVLNPYIKITSELFRNYGQLPRRIMTEKGQAANMAKWAASMGALYYGVKAYRETQGVSQSEVDAAFASAPAAIQRFKPGALALWDRDPKTGKLRFIDTTQLFQPISWMPKGDGNPVAEVMGNIGMSLAGPFAQDGLGDVLQDFGVDTGLPQNPKTPGWQQDSLRGVGKLLVQLGPGSVRNTYNTLERGQVGFEGKGGRLGEAEAQDALTTGFNAVLGPNRMFQAGSRQDKDRSLLRARADYEEARREYKRLARMNEGQSTGPGTLPLDKQAALKKAAAVIDEKAKEIDRLNKLLKGNQ